MRLRFGEFRLDSETRQLTRRRQPVHLTPKAFRLLELLLERRPQAISKAALYEILWPATAVSETNLAHLVAEVRGALGDDHREPRYVRTVYGHGYAFSGSATNDDDDRRPASSSPRRWSQHAGWWAFAAVGAAAAAALLLGGARSWSDARQSRWARQEALPEIERRVADGDYAGAFQLAGRVEALLPADPVLVRLWPQFSAEVSLMTSPAGADVYVQPYGMPEGGWEHLGQTPLAARRMPLGYKRWRVVKPGFRGLERASWANSQEWTLSPVRGGPSGMVSVPAATLSPGITGLVHLPRVPLEAFWIDRTEVTNRRFKEFVDAGGYSTREYWKEPFLRDGRAVGWDEAMKAFRDSTGRPGPASWVAGNLPEGEEDHPVCGVSWYEAAAYAVFAHKRLPTVYHWSQAAGPWASPEMTPLSNIGRRLPGPRPVGQRGAISHFGAYDMAGNVKEWCWNESRDGKRYILGGAWNEPAYMFLDADAQSPWDRQTTYGFRCFSPGASTVLREAAAMPAFEVRRDYARESPAADSIFSVYRSLYSYDRTPLEVRLESKDDSQQGFRIEKVSFAAAYAAERVLVYLALPKRGRQPHQAVVFFPGVWALHQRVFEADEIRDLTFLIDSGRAVIFPIFKGTYERKDGLDAGVPAATSFYRDHVVAWAKDLGRTIDYLETRHDIDGARLAYYGFSWGATLPQLLALERRFRAAVLVGGGFHFTRPAAEVDALHFAPRVQVPVLMLNGREDFFFPPASSQEPLFSLLGTAAADKRRVLFESNHIPPRHAVIRETLNWLDRYLGPVP